MPPSKLAVYRRKKGLTQEHLAELSGVTARTIQRIEKGSVVPHIQTLKILAGCLEIDPELLMDAAEGNIAEQEQSNVKQSSITPLFHLLALIGMCLPILNIVFPFLLWLLKRQDDPEDDQQGKQVLNFHLSMSMLLFPAIALMIFYFPVGFPLTAIIYVFMFSMTLLNLYRSIKILPVKYPLSFTFL